ncbi:hypothetical protein IL306_006532 [Fusarium sp. DS 682]|nr:hypothetical protein IL306_006532 [Fusarium sp. DS 682]
MAVTEAMLNAERTTPVETGGLTDEDNVNTEDLGFDSVNEPTPNVQHDFGYIDPCVLFPGVQADNDQFGYPQPVQTLNTQTSFPNNTANFLEPWHGIINHLESFYSTDEAQTHENVSADIPNAGPQAPSEATEEVMTFFRKKIRNAEKEIAYVEKVCKNGLKSQSISRSHDMGLVQHQMCNVYQHIQDCREQIDAHERQIKDLVNLTCGRRSCSEGPVKTLSDLKNEDLYGGIGQSRSTFVDPSIGALVNPRNPSLMKRRQKRSRNNQRFA